MIFRFVFAVCALATLALAVPYPYPLLPPVVQFVNAPSVVVSGYSGAVRFIGNGSAEYFPMDDPGSSYGALHFHGSVSFPELGPRADMTGDQWGQYGLVFGTLAFAYEVQTEQLGHCASLAIGIGDNDNGKIACGSWTSPGAPTWVQKCTFSLDGNSFDLDVTAVTDVNNGLASYSMVPRGFSTQYSFSLKVVKSLNYPPERSVFTFPAGCSPFDHH